MLNRNSNFIGTCFFRFKLFINIDVRYLNSVNIAILPILVFKHIIRLNKFYQNFI